MAIHALQIGVILTIYVPPLKTKMTLEKVTMNEDVSLLLKNDKVLQLIMLYSFRRCANWDDSSIFLKIHHWKPPPKVELNELLAVQSRLAVMAKVSLISKSMLTTSRSDL